MAEVLFAALEALDPPKKGVASVAGTTVAGYQRFTTVNGPIKIEYTYYQQAASNNFAASDTFKSGLARPIAAAVDLVNVDSANTDTGAPSATLEASEAEDTFKTVTVHDADTTSEAGLLIRVYGY